MDRKLQYSVILLITAIMIFLLNSAKDIYTGRRQFPDIPGIKTKLIAVDISGSTTLETTKYTEPISTISFVTDNTSTTTYTPVITTTQPVIDINIKEEGTFKTLDNEPYFYVRSAYLDNRFNPPTVQILSVMGTVSVPLS